MSRRWLVVPCAGAVLAAVLAALQHTPTRAQPAPEGEVAARPAPLPISQVVLFNSGVGYFQRDGEVEGAAKVDLTFPVRDVNDLLKSLVLQDLGGGRISTVNYDSSDPIDKTLKSFALDLTSNPTFGELLNMSRGEKVEVVAQAANLAPATLSGVIVGMEEQAESTGPTGEKLIHVLNLHCTEGLRGVKLSEVQRVRFLNPVFDSEFRRALEVLAGAHDLQKKAVTLHFTGEGKRKVRVGYVVENPIWKTTYRLIFDKDGKLHLQGWAAVENTSDEDWKDVRMALVAGRPISFQMDLYQPLYNPRPLVEPEYLASLRPPAYSGPITSYTKLDGFDRVGLPVQIQGALGGGLGAIGGGLGALGGLGGGLGGNLGGGNLGGAFGIQGGGNLGASGGGNRYQRGGPTRATGTKPEDGEEHEGRGADRRLSYEELKARLKGKEASVSEARQVGEQIARLDPTQGVAAAATAQALGEHYQYRIDQAVSLPRQKSALVPILNEPVAGKHFSIYNEAVDRSHPLLGLRLKAPVGRPLTQGPITVFEGGAYAGDSRIADLQPAEERLLAYAVDPGTEVTTTSEERPERLRVGLKLTNLDSIQVAFKQRRTKSYVLRNRSERERLVLIEHPVQKDWKLVTPEKPAEQAADVYRFEVASPAGKTVRFEVVEEQDRTLPVTLNHSNADRRTCSLPQLRVEFEAVHTLHPHQLTSAHLVKGTIKAAFRTRATRSYYVRNLEDVERTVVLDLVVLPYWKRISPQTKDAPDEPTQLTLTLPAGKTIRQDVVEEILNPEEYAALFADIAWLKSIEGGPASSPAVKEAIKKVLELRDRLQATHQEQTEAAAELKEIGEDQVRLRANLKEMPKEAAAYQRYLEKFDRQESQVEKLREQMKKLAVTEKQRDQDIRDFVANLTVD